MPGKCQDEWGELTQEMRPLRCKMGCKRKGVIRKGLIKQAKNNGKVENDL